MPKQTVDLNLDKRAAQEFQTEVLSRDPFCWANPVKLDRLVTEVLLDWEKANNLFLVNAPSIQWQIAKKLFEPDNLRLILNALEAFFKYGNQKMKYRQELRDNPLRDINPLILASALTQNSSPNQLNTLEIGFRTDPVAWRTSWEKAAALIK